MHESEISEAPGNQPIARILVATDFSAQAETALCWAQRFSAAFGCKLILLHVIDVFGLAETSCHMIGSDFLPVLRDQARDNMHRWHERVPQAEALIREGSPRPMIVDAAAELRCQMIVMGTHGRSGLAHLLLGSVAEYVVRHSKVPVLTVGMPAMPQKS
ncbi:MAG TPA: universal stress protein [Terriglobales bacterium]|nr:universal stress protein [Terriglobales bacterium]